MKKKLTPEQIDRKFQSFLKKANLAEEQQKEIPLADGRKRVIKKRARDAKYTVLFQNDLFLKAKAIAWHERGVSFNQMVNKGLEMWINDYIRVHGNDILKEIMDERNQNQEYLHTQKELMKRTRENRKE